jgi:DNA primase
LSLSVDFDLKERVRTAIDIVDVIGSQLELRPQGRNFVARCPWHNDRRPSMTVNQERQTWKCWVCDIGGDIFSYVMQRDGLDFPTALRQLAEQAGIPIEETRRGKASQPGSPEDKATLFAALKLIADAYVNELAKGTSDDCKIARDYLAERGISDESRERFQIGFSPESWNFAVDLLKANSFSPEVAEAAGLAINKQTGRGHYDRFRGRLMFPIHDLQNRVISLGGRVIPKIAARLGEDSAAGAKYINGPETRVFRKSHQLYGLQLAREAIRHSGQVLVMEGYTDVIAARQAGVEPVVAVLGTALGEEHVKILKRFAQRVVLVLDGDEAGQRRAEEVLELFVRADVDLRILTLPNNNDPAEYLAEHGLESFNRLVAEAPDALDHKFAGLTEGIDITRDTHRVTTAIDTMLGLLAKAPASNGLRTDQLVVRLARTFGIASDRLQERLETLRKKTTSKFNRLTSAQSSSRAPQRNIDPNDAFNEVGDAGYDASYGDSYSARESVREDHAPLPHRLPPITGMDRQLFEVLIESPELAAMAVEAIDPEWLDSITAKMLLSVYQDLDLAGRELRIDSLLLAIENESLKNVVVTLQERIAERDGKMMIESSQQYAALLTRYREREWSVEQTRQIAKLQSSTMAEDEELALLQEILEAERTRQGAKTSS